MSITFSRGDGYEAEVSVAGQHLSLLAHINENGYVAFVFDKNRRKALGDPQSVTDFDDGKQYAIHIAATYLQQFTKEKFPTVEWRPTAYLQNKLDRLEAQTAL
jgi:hypothetical protein